MIKEKFQELGLNSTEAQVYLALAELGKASAQVLSRKATLARTTVYSALDNLVKKGLVSLDAQSSTRFFVANEPGSLLKMLEAERNAIGKKEKVAKLLMEEISPFFKSANFSIPKLQVLEEAKNVENMLYTFLPDWNRSLVEGDNTWWGYQDPTLLENYSEWIYYTWKTMPKEQKIWLFSQADPLRKKLKGMPRDREIRPVPKGINFSSTIFICGEYIVLLMTKHKPHYAFQIKDAVFASNLKAIFMMLWQATATKRRKR